MAELGGALGAGAVDLGQLAEQAQARREMETTPFSPFITVTEADLEARVFQRSAQIPVVLLVGTSRSEESEALQETLRTLAEGQREFLVAYLDADAGAQLVQLLGVRALPTVIALAAGRPVASFEGNQPLAELKQWLDSLVKNVGPQLEGLGESDDDVDAAKDAEHSSSFAAANAALSAGDFDAALALYDEVLAADPTNSEAKRAKAAVYVVKRLDPLNRDSDPIQEADAAPQDAAKQLVAADAEVLAQEPERAFDRLLRVIQSDPAGPAGAVASEAKERLFELFALFDPADTRVIQARTNLASVLF